MSWIDRHSVVCEGFLVHVEIQDMTTATIIGEIVVKESIGRLTTGKVALGLARNIIDLSKDSGSGQQRDQLVDH